jgi:hypothetical protein
MGICKEFLLLRAENQNSNRNIHWWHSHWQTNHTWNNQEKQKFLHQKPELGNHYLLRWPSTTHCKETVKLWTRKQKFQNKLLYLDAYLGLWKTSTALVMALSSVLNLLQNATPEWFKFWYEINSNPLKRGTMDVMVYFSIENNHDVPYLANKLAMETTCHHQVFLNSHGANLHSWYRVN